MESGYHTEPCPVPRRSEAKPRHYLGVTPAVSPHLIYSSRVPFFKYPHPHIHIFSTVLGLQVLVFLSIIMRAAFYLSAFLCASLAAASGAIDAFKRVDRVLEPRVAAQHNAPAHSHERLQKRASPYLNNVTQSECTEEGDPHPRC